ncbi:HAD-IA family hydrolase [Acinetobacter indicus]|uniref:HAD-IA family hydrolase n=1 Tax=Acinetobacter indicus TaxID=756892 RepID=UPI0025773F15|nr:HAD-IA family hydrolase [Acinetobacter indicus]MDM1302866.1 HAD-IA family hydrolase [Acinetobacter indicus]
MKIYSFDLFDTLVARKVNQPKDVFLLMEASNRIQYRSIFFKKIGFYKIRIFCEKFSRFINRNRSEDVSISNIYMLVGFFLKNKEEIMSLEVSIEQKIVYPLKFNIGILNAMRGKGKICITSDMYLPRNVIIDILHKNDIYYDLVYVSSDVGLTKASGNLFKYISDDNGVNLNDIYHYGDNEWSDVIIPSKLGINVHHVGNAVHYKSDNVFDVFNIKSSDPLFNIGYEFCGPFSFAFSKFIKDNSKNKRIVFGARDAYLFERAFKNFHNNFGNETFYTRVSRNLVYIPEAFVTKNYDKFFEGSLTCEEFFKRLNLTCPTNFIAKKVWDVKKDLEIYLNESNDFNNYIKNKHDTVKNYLLKNGFEDKIAFVDIGWRGSVQDSISNILSPNISVSGLYVGVLSNNINKIGFVFNNKKPSLYYFYIFQSLPFFEFCFTEPVNSLNTITENDSGFNFLFTDDEESDHLELRRKIQLGAENFFTDYKFVIKDLGLEFDDSYINNLIFKLIKKNFMQVDPKLVDILKKFSHSAGFNASIRSSLIEFNKLSLLGYLQAPWKAYFMYELKKKSLFKYYIFLILFHNFIFFIFYENFKKYFRKIRALIHA